MIPDPKDLLGRLGALQSELPERLRAIQVEATAGGGMVTVTCNGLGEVSRVRIDPEVVERSEVEALEDLVRAAVNGAQERARARAREETQKLFSGLPLPDIFGNLPA
jgi:DNA-binding YbaB/EbfC family protein